MIMRNAARHALVAVILGFCAGASALEAPAPVYFSATQIDSIVLLEPPPAKGSGADQRDLQAVLARQQAAHSDGTLERAVGDAELSCGRIAEVLPATAPAAPAAQSAVPPAREAPASAVLSSGDGAAAIDFASRAALQAAGAVGPAKQYWHRPRPYMLSAQVERRGDVAPDYPMPPELARERDISAYPSGHTAFGTACAIVLAQMVPEQRAALFARARLYGESRLIVGAHYPTDVEAGRIIGTAAAAVMLQNHQYQQDLRHAAAGLRSALGLPAIAP
jgi:acid phosphatase (class A)